MVPMGTLSHEFEKLFYVYSITVSMLRCPV